ncbi:hypothetical protein M378DRAFT_913685 [Amanita muscaria Koide BX008]|uniref:Uncharacterized protein n=1 Tax=Amanita muscaria (strain Koide BX008) TaxID=946122 RepID=A0A0C2WUV0_AMAMK|nr:hypothetical protein M378DRAFT_913685 [Amanita muscaria Koide BX008]
MRFFSIRHCVIYSFYISLRPAMFKSQARLFGSSLIIKRAVAVLYSIVAVHMARRWYEPVLQQLDHWCNPDVRSRKSKKRSTIS